MYAATKGIIEDFASKIEEINDKNGNAAYFLLYPNKKLGHSDGDEVWNQEVILKAYEAPFGKWEWRSDAVHSNPAASSVFFTDWGSKNCKGIIYNIPNNNIIPMEHHITQIRGAQRCNVPMVINIDSAIQDESFFKKLLDEKVIRATFGTQDKLPAPSFWASLFKNKTFKYGSIGLFITLILYDCYRFAWWYYYAQCLGYPTCFKLFLPSLLRELSDFCYRVRYI
jgi:hypothetical protein